MSGVRLIKQHPRVADRDCDFCQKWQHDEKTGLPVEVRKGTGVYHPRYSPLPCRSTGCPKGTPEAPKSLSDRNRSAYLHYLRGRAVNRWPDDPIVERNAMLIRSVEDEFEREERARFEQTLVQLVVK